MSAENMPDAESVARNFAQRLLVNASYAESVKFSVANLSTMSVEDCRALADWIDHALAAPITAGAKPVVWKWQDRKALAAHLAVGAEAKAVAHQHRLRVKGDSGSWTEWRDGCPCLSPETAALLDIEERDLYATPPAPAVKVKALEFAAGRHPMIYEAGEYIIEDQGSNWTGGDRFFLFFGGMNAKNKIGRYGTRTKAIQAANAHHEARIRSALAEDAGADYMTATQTEMQKPEHDGLFSTPASAPAADGMADRLDAAYVGEDLEIMGGKFLRPTELGKEAAARIRSDATTIASLRAEVEKLRRVDQSCESENCSDCPQEVVQNVSGWGEPTGEVIAVARGGVVEVSYCAALPPASDADSDDEFWVQEPSIELAAAKIAAELERRAALAPIPAKEG